jgi:hypothetical protein
MTHFWSLALGDRVVAADSLGPGGRLLVADSGLPALTGSRSPALGYRILMGRSLAVDEAASGGGQHFVSGDGKVRSVK